MPFMYDYESGEYRYFYGSVSSCSSKLSFKMALFIVFILIVLMFVFGPLDVKEVINYSNWFN